MAISPITDIIADMQHGRMVVLLDDEDRENEGDLVMAASQVRPEDINFMARYGRGLICLTLDQERCQQLQLPLMVSDTQQRQSTNFTVTIEAAIGVTTGISAADRATTIRAAVHPDAKPSDIVMPGHVFPIMAQRGGVLARAGHTEAGVDLARMAGLPPASVICEIMNEDGTMARLPQLEVFAAEHGLKIGTIAELIRYRMENESTVQRVGEYTLATEHGDFRAVLYHDDISGAEHLALVLGKIDRQLATLVRVHVQETLLDTLTDVHRAGSWTVGQALHRVAAEGNGIVVLLDQPAGERAITKHLARLKQRTEDRNLTPLKRGREELRSYGVGSQILTDLGVGKMRVMGHAIKVPGMSGFGLEIVEYLESSHQPQQATTKKATQ